MLIVCPQHGYHLESFSLCTNSVKLNQTEEVFTFLCNSIVVSYLSPVSCVLYDIICWVSSPKKCHRVCFSWRVMHRRNTMFQMQSDQYEMKKDCHLPFIQLKVKIICSLLPFLGQPHLVRIMWKSYLWYQTFCFLQLYT